MAHQTIVDQRLALAVVPVVASAVLGPVDHAATAPPVVAGQVDRRAARAAVAHQVAAALHIAVLGEILGDIRLLDRHQPDALAALVAADLAGRAGEVAGVPLKRAHGAAVRALGHAAEPLEVEHKAIDRELGGAQIAQGVVDLVPVVVAIFRDPQAQRLLGRHGRPAGQLHIVLAQVGQVRAAHHIPAQLVAPGLDLPRAAVERPLLLVELVEEQAVGWRCSARPRTGSGSGRCPPGRCRRRRPWRCRRCRRASAPAHPSRRRSCRR